VSDPFVVAQHKLPHLGLWKTLKDRRRPISFDLELTARCNNDCRHCCICLPAGDATAKAAELRTDEVLGIAREVADMGAVWCLLIGGEPLLRSDFAALYLGLKRLGLLVSVFTNACLVTAEHVELFRRYPPRDVEVTVYGGDARDVRSSHASPRLLRRLRARPRPAARGWGQGAAQGDGSAVERSRARRDLPLLP